MNYNTVNEIEFSEEYLMLRKRVREQIAERTISALTDVSLLGTVLFDLYQRFLRLNYFQL